MNKIYKINFVKYARFDGTVTQFPHISMHALWPAFVSELGQDFENRIKSYGDGWLSPAAKIPGHSKQNSGTMMLHLKTSFLATSS